MPLCNIITVLSIIYVGGKSMITNTKRYLLNQTIFTVMCLLLFVIFIFNSNIVSESIRSSINLCTQTIIPSLFPFFIISELLISSNMWSDVEKIIDKPFNIIFGLSGMSLYPVIIGMLCGFPVGAKVTMSLLDKNCISKKEAERVLCLCNNPSPTFIINVVGISIYSNKKLGIIFWCTTILTTIIIGLGCKFLFGKVHTISPSPNPLKSKIKALKLSQIIGESVSPMLKTCAYIIFFAALMECLKKYMIAIGINTHVMTILHGIIELSGGVISVSSLNPSPLSMCLLAFIIGWSGISVHLQIMSICQNHNISLKPYIAAKSVQGLLNTIIILNMYVVNPDLFDTDKNSAYIPSFHAAYTPFIKSMTVALFIIIAIFYLYKNVTKKRLVSYIDIRRH